MSTQDVTNALRSVPASSTTLRRQDFTAQDATPGEKSLIAEHKANTPTVVRRDRGMRLAFTTVEQFTHGGTGVETFALSHDVMQTINTADVVVYLDGSRVGGSAITVDYDADEVDVDDSSGGTLHIYYVPRDAAEISVEIAAPGTQGRTTQVIYDDVTKLLHSRDQNQEPPELRGSEPLDFVIPRKWRLQVYADGPVPFAFTDDHLGNPQDTEASNAMLKIPVRKASEDVPGLGDAVKRHFVR